MSAWLSPAKLRSTGKQALRAWGMLTGRARPLPDFLIIGTKRGGTSSMYRYLLAHPQVLPLFPSDRHFPMAANIKGVHYLDSEWHRSVSWYRSYFPSEVSRAFLRRKAGVPVISGEATPYYLYHPLAAERARQLMPDVKLIVLLRNPVNRAYSHYKEQRRRGFEDLVTFEEALAAEDVRLMGEEDRLINDPQYVSFRHEHQSYAFQGKYHRALSRWLERFPREQLLILSSEEFYSDTQRIYDSVLGFLTLPHFELESTAAWNAIVGAGINSALRRRLQDEFAPDNQALERELHRDFGWNEPDQGKIRPRTPDTTTLFNQSLDDS